MSTMTNAEIDTLAVPARHTAGPRPIDGLPRDSIYAKCHVGGHDAAAAEWMRRSIGLAQRMVAACAARYGWSAAQIAAAEEAAMRIPTSATRGKHMRTVEPLPVLIEAARRAA